MAKTIVQNKRNLSAILHFTGNATVNVVGNTARSEIATATESANIHAAHISQVWYGSSSGNGVYWIVERTQQSGNIVVGVFDSTGWIDFAGNGGALTLGSNGDLIVSLYNASEGEAFLMIELQKIGPWMAA